MFRPCYLFNPDGRDQLLYRGAAFRLPQSLLGVVLALPRELCIYLRLDATGIPLLRLQAFVRLQLLSQSPIREPGVFVARQGNLLHVWLWESKWRAEFAARHKLPASRISTVPSGLLVTPPSQDGAIFVRTLGAQGVEAQLWQSRALVHDGWFEAAPAELEWNLWRDEVGQQEGVQWPSELPRTQEIIGSKRAWARNLFRDRGGLPVSTGLFWPGVLSAATLATAGYVAWLYGQMDYFEKTVADSRSGQSDLESALKPIQHAREQALSGQRWILQAQQLTAGSIRPALIEQIGRTVTAQGAVVRELEVQGGKVRVTLVPAVGELALTPMVEALSQISEFEDVRFVDGAGTDGFRFEWRLRDARAANGGRS
ncbi:hypothetical protein VLK31_03510 [Variovorax sp. H27-G14]|uniref:hypothetical protein n=1 Tax=Variovorax sp. H27-G14 TaxID=3111914 RepID=UPI0038FC924E